MWEYFTVQQPNAFDFDKYVNEKIKEGFAVKDTYVFPETPSRHPQFIAVMHRFNEEK